MTFLSESSSLFAKRPHTSCHDNASTEGSCFSPPCSDERNSGSLSPASDCQLPDLRSCVETNTKEKFSSSRRRLRHLNRFSIIAFMTMSIQRSHAFAPQGSHKTFTMLNVRSASSTTQETIEAVMPLTSSSKEKRLSAQRAWEKARAIDLEDTMDGEADTPLLDLFTDAGIATVKNLSPKNSEKKYTRPRGRPDSVPGAMSRATLLNKNEKNDRARNISNQKNASLMYRNRQEKIKTDPSTSKKKRGRGRPRKYPVSSTSIDEITTIAATTALPGKDTAKANSLGGIYTSSEERDELKSNDKLNYNKSRGLGEEGIRSRNIRDEGESTGMMQSPGSKKGKGDSEPPNLQRYYRTELLSSEEEYTIGMKIQFMMKCELVHEGLCEHLGRVPSIAEWSFACGFDECDDISNDPKYSESDLYMQIRPSNSEAREVKQDPNMFVGNGLVNASGPGRGRGRAKKTPPTSLEPFYDDSDIKILQSKENLSDKEVKKLVAALQPVNRGSSKDFVDVMLTAREAKQRMVQSNMRLVVSISKRYKHVGVNIADLVQEGSIGLTRAAEKFDPKRGFKFSTYASWWIQQAVFRSIAYHSRTIRLPVHVHNLLNRVRRVRLELQRILGRTPTHEEMARELDMPPEKYNKMMRLTRKAISLDMAKYQNNPKDNGQESETSLGDTIDSSEVLNDECAPETKVDQDLFRDDLQEMLKILGEDERAVISARYGLRDGLTRTVTTVAAQMGQTKSWVRSQECRALRKLRRPWYEKRLWEHQNSLTG